jgi:hypothetical protein
MTGKFGGRNQSRKASEIKQESSYEKKSIDMEERFIYMQNNN